MLYNNLKTYIKFYPFLTNYRGIVLSKYLNTESEYKYTDAEKENILNVINEADAETIKRYSISKGRINKYKKWKNNNGKLNTLEDLELVEGFCYKSSIRLFNSILEGPTDKNMPNKIKGHFLQPILEETLRQSCRTVLAINVAVNSVCWALIEKDEYKLVEWKYFGIDFRAERKLKLTDIFSIVWSIMSKLPNADLCVMAAEATTLRAPGSDPNNPRVMVINLQKSQMIAMLVALFNARCINNQHRLEQDKESECGDDTQRVFFLRSSLPYRLYGTLVGGEKTTTDHAVEVLMNSLDEDSKKSNVKIDDKLKSMFRSQSDLQRDMLGHCLLLSLTFMDLCIYKNLDSINRLIKHNM